MAGVRVTIDNTTGQPIYAAELPHDVAMRRLIPALVTRLGLPILGSDGQPISYRLYHNSHEIGQDVDLAHAGVVDGATVTLSYEATAGAGRRG